MKARHKSRTELSHHCESPRASVSGYITTATPWHTTTNVAATHPKNPHPLPHIAIHLRSKLLTTVVETSQELWYHIQNSSSLPVRLLCPGHLELHCRETRSSLLISTTFHHLQMNRATPAPLHPCSNQLHFFVEVFAKPPATEPRHALSHYRKPRRAIPVKPTQKLTKRKKKRKFQPPTIKPPT